MFEVKKELLDSHEVLLEVVFEDEAVDGAKRRAARKMSRELNIPGFRQGRAPYAKVLHYVGEPAVVQEAAELLLDGSYSEILEAAEVSPYGLGEFVDMQPSPLTFKIRVPLEPVVDLGDYKSLREDWTEATISDEEIEQVLAQVREEHAILEPVDRAAEMADELRVNVHATAGDDVIIDEDDIEVVLSEERPFFSLGFVAALVGMSADEESTFTLALPESMEDPDLQGAEAEFTVKVTQVFERKLPELDDALASTVGSFESFDELKQDVIDRIMTQKTEQAESVYRNQMTAKLVEMATSSYPPQMVSDTLDDIVGETSQRIQRQSKMSLEDALRLEGRTIEQFREEAMPQAEDRVKQSLVLRQFALAESIDVGDDEIVKEYSEFLAQIGMAGQMADNDLDLGSPMANNLRNTVLGRKVMARLMAIGRGEADAGAEPGATESVDVQDESEAVAEVETSVEEAAPAGAEPADEAPGDGASGAEETEA
ncbi:MAG: trigger factor [Anaerolineae bacterium]|nr:trigger factor [Anaerolineae bacterium]